MKLRISALVAIGVFAVASGGALAAIPTLATLVTFNGGNGESPYAGVIIDANGNLFGTTEQGGAYGYGTVFEVVNMANGYAIWRAQ